MNCCAFSYRQVWGYCWSKHSPSKSYWLHLCDGFWFKAAGSGLATALISQVGALCMQSSQGGAQADQTSIFCLSFIALVCVVKPIQQELLWSPHTWAKPAFWSHTPDPVFLWEEDPGREGRSRENKWLKTESNSLWHALYLALPILPTTFSFYNQNSVNPCGVVIINFID